MSPSDPEVVRVDVALLEAPLSVDIVTSQGIPGPPGPEGPPGPSGAVAHAPTHNTGGADPISALSAAVLTTGTIPNARLAADVLVAGSVAVGTNPAASGAVRLANNQAITARNAGNTADIAVMKTDGGNSVLLGSLANAAATYLDSGSNVIVRSAAASYTVAGFGVYPNDDASRDLGFSGGRFKDAYLSGSVSLGTNPAQSGAVRLPSGGDIKARDAANGSDIHVLSLSGGGAIVLGQYGQPMYLQASSITNLGAHFQLQEVGAPSPPAANNAHLWLEDNGAGKSRLMIQFATGAAIAIATQV